MYWEEQNVPKDKKGNLIMPRYKLWDEVVITPSWKTPYWKFYEWWCWVIKAFRFDDTGYSYYIKLNSDNESTTIGEDELELVYDDEVECICDECKKDLWLCDDDEVECEERYIEYIKDVCSENRKYLKAFIKEWRDNSWWAKDMLECMNLLYDILDEEE